MAAEPSEQVKEQPSFVARASLFGEFRLTNHDGTEIALSNRRARALLAILCLEPNQPMAREQITRLLWSGRFEAQAKASLRQCLLELSKTLEPLEYPLLMVTRERIAINGPKLRTDLADLEQALTYGQYEEAVQALTLIGANQLLDDLHLGEAFTDWLAARREQTTLRLQASVNLALDDLEQRAEHGMRRRLLAAWTACAPLASSRIVHNGSDGKTRIAVLPFQALGTAEASDYFTDGMVDELITTLGHVPQLLVAGRTSSFHFRGSELSLARIAAELGVSHLIEGSVQRQGERVRIHAHLIAGETGFELWGDRFDGTLEDVFALQDKIGQAITAAIGNALGIDVQQPPLRDQTHSREAYDLFLQGRALSFRLFGDGTLDTAVTLLNQAVALDPDFAEAWLLLGEVHQLIAIYTACLDRPAESALMAKCVDRALAIKPDLGQAYSLLGLHQMIQNDFVGALDLAFKGYEMAPNNPQVAMRLGSYLMFCGRTADGMHYIEQALAQDPIDGRKHMLRGTGRFNSGDIDGAIADYQRSVDLGFASIYLAVATAATGQYDLAVEQYMQTRLLLNKSIFPPAGTTPMTPEVMDAYWLVAAKGVCSGKAEDREAYCRTLDYLHLTMHDNGDHAIALPTVFMGYTEMLYKTLGERISPSNMACLISIWADIDPIRQIWQHPEFIPFAQRIGMAAAWDKFGWPDLLPPPTNLA